MTSFIVVRIDYFQLTRYLLDFPRTKVQSLLKSLRTASLRQLSSETDTSERYDYTSI